MSEDPQDGFVHALGEREVLPILLGEELDDPDDGGLACVVPGVDDIAEIQDVVAGEERIPHHQAGVKRQPARVVETPHGAAPEIV